MAGRLGGGGGPASVLPGMLFPLKPPMLQEGKGELAQQRVVMQTAPAPALDVAQPQLVLELLVHLLPGALRKKTSNRLSPEVRQRAVRMGLEHGGDLASPWPAIGSIASKIGCTAETRRKGVRQAERDRGPRSGPRTSEQERIKALERENRELRPRQPDPAQGSGLCCHGGAEAPVAAMIAVVDDHRQV
jgi:transposase